MDLEMKGWVTSLGKVYTLCVRLESLLAPSCSLRSLPPCEALLTWLAEDKNQLECLISLPAAVRNRNLPWELKLILKDLVQSFPLFRQCLVDMSGASFRRQSTYQPAGHQPQEMTHIVQNKNPSEKKNTCLAEDLPEGAAHQVMVSTSEIKPASSTHLLDFWMPSWTDSHWFALT